MSDFAINKKGERSHEIKAFSFTQTTKKKLSLYFKLAVFFATFFGLIYLSMNSNNLLLSEILVVGGILSLIFLVHILSN